MTSHNRHRSRGSLSILNQIRSLSRTGSRQDPSSHERSPSSLSCNPQRQPQSQQLPGPVLPSLSPATVEGLIKSPTTALPQLPSTILETPPPPYEKQARLRPLSWLSIPNVLKGHTARSRSIHLPKEGGDSVGKSVISTPILTGTSNVKVARAEGVECEALVHQGRPAWKKTEHSHEKSGRFNDIIRTMRKKRPKSTEYFTEHDNLLSVENGVARRRAETVNLGSEKINKLTGHGHIRRKSIAEAETTTSRNGKDPLRPSNTSSHFVGIESSSDFGFSSLTRSFASAVDKLDFYSTQPSMGNLPKSKSSIFNFRKRERDGKVEEKNQIIDEEMKKPKFADTSKQRDKDMSKKPDQDVLTLRELLVDTARDRSYHPLTTALDPEPTRFDAVKNAYVPSDAVANYPRGVNPLRMHINPMEFATAPPGVELPNPQITNKFSTIEEDDDDDMIEDAPIYSPSSGDLSQYNRLTPSPATTIDEEEVEDTPTRMPGQKSYMQRLGLKKSRSGLGLFARKKALGMKDGNQKVLTKSRSMHFGLFKKEDDFPNPESNFLPVTPSPLRTFVTTPEPGFHPRELPRTMPNNVKRRGVVGMPVEEDGEKSE